MGSIVFGVDFDNTIAGYDTIFHQAAFERGLIGEDVTRSKDSVRDAVRLSSFGETEWQKLQALVYGPRMSEATPNDGVLSFIKECGLRDVPVFVISHKTEFANLDETGTNLREAALNWLDSAGFFDAGTGLTTDRVYFENTRMEKLARIEALGCTHFVDDLLETLQEKSFPSGVEKILYAPDGRSDLMTGGSTIGSWSEAVALLSPVAGSPSRSN